jgi:hypothetical protein
MLRQRGGNDAVGAFHASAVLPELGGEQRLKCQARPMQRVEFMIGGGSRVLRQFLSNPVQQLARRGRHLMLHEPRDDAHHHP